MKHLYCSLFGHEYKVSKSITYYIKEYKCLHCNNQVTTDAKGKLIKLTEKHKEINSVLEQIHLKKVKRKKVLIEH